MIKFDHPAGATPIDDSSGLIPSWIKTQGDVNRAEAENISSAQKEYLQKKVSLPNNWFNVSTLKEIHQAMFGNVWTWAGQFRQKDVTSIGVEPYLIASTLSEFCSEVQAWSQDIIELTFLERAARIHHRLVFI